MNNPLQTIRRLFRHRPVRYLFIGGVSYCIELSSLLALSSALSFSPTEAVAWSFWVGLTSSFVLQKLAAFQNKEKNTKAFGRQLLLYACLVLFNYGFTLLFVGWTNEIIGLMAARTIALILTVSWNYLIYKEIFKQR